MSAKCDIEQQPLIMPGFKPAFSVKGTLLRPIYHMPLVKTLCHWVDRLFAKRKVSKVLLDWQSDQSSQEKLCVFAHYDAQGDVQSYVLNYLEVLNAHQFSIVFVTSGDLTEAAQQQLRGLCHRIMCRNNIGRDFMSYKVGLQAMGDLTIYQQLLITNDSFFVSKHSISKALLMAQRSDIDMFGLTDCEQHQYHLQSYFLLLKPAVFLSDRFQQFWRQVLPLTVKSNIVQFYEIGFSQQLIKAGFKLKALCSVAKMKRDLASNRFLLPETARRQLTKWLSKKYNPCFYCWWLIIKYYDCTMIKRDLLQRNPMGMNLGKWQQVFKSHTDFPVNTIEQALEGVNQ
ncbi:MAG: rhamnan synthesis F family protein [Coxiellaceae bacterium]|nr:rhamnan synthesis F family protein [Coxiellaceae bacterium]